MPNLPEVTIAILLRGEPPAEVLLGLKKRGIGLGLHTGIGGRVESGETPFRAAVRELREEVGVEALEDDLRHLGKLSFLFPARPTWSMIAHVFVAERWSGEPRETEEISPAWFPFTRIPYDKMWHDYSFWLRRALQDQDVTATFIYSSDNKTVASVQQGVARSTFEAAQQLAEADPAGGAFRGA